MYHGRVRLSFCTDKASSTAVTQTTAAYRNVVNCSARPHRRRSQAQATTETANAALPSNVLEDVGDQR